MTRETRLRTLLTAIERQREIGFNEHGDPLDVSAVNALEQRVLQRLAYVKLLRPDCPGVVE